jgi:hypothetical protein
MKPAIYEIACIPTGRRYIGSSIMPNDRRRGHFHDLRKGKGVNKAIQADFDKYGQAAFTWRLVATALDKSALLELEEQVIASFNPEYNVTRKPSKQSPTPGGRFLTAQGITDTLAGWSRRHGVNPITIHYRIETLGWPVEEAVGAVPRTPPVRSYDNVKKLRYEYKGHSYTIDQLAKLAGINRQTLYQRLRLGWTVEQAVGDEPGPKAKALAEKKPVVKRPRGRPPKNELGYMK